MRIPQRPDPLEVFLNSITAPLEPSILPEPEPIRYTELESIDEDITIDHNQRKSSRLANKAKSRIGKNTILIAQELLIKKLGELTPQKSISDELNLENFSQHLDYPLNKTEMEALQDLVEHGTKLEKKAGKSKVVAAKC